MTQELNDFGFPRSMTQEQKEIILMPFDNPSKFNANGAISPRKAKKFWVGRLGEVGGSPFLKNITETHWKEHNI
jgi:hypothetical protein